MNEKFYGEQTLGPDAGIDTVRYEGATGEGVDLTASVINGILTQNLHISSGATGEDDLFGIERIELSDNADHLRVNSNNMRFATTIDAKGQQDGQRDILDFSGLNSAVSLKQQGNGDLYVSGGSLFGSLSGVGGVTYANFEEVILTSKNDTIDISLAKWCSIMASWFLPSTHKPVSHDQLAAWTSVTPRSPSARRFRCRRPRRLRHCQTYRR